jgi:energy-coupling factor transporter ATP-binding protein EcfA2
MDQLGKHSSALVIGGTIILFVGLFMVYYHSDSSMDSFYLNDLLEYALVILKQNQFCQAILMSTCSAYVVYIVGMIYRYAILPLFSKLSCSITIHNDDPNYNAVIDYLAGKILQDNSVIKSSLQACTHKKKKTRKDWIQEYLGTNLRDLKKFEFRPDNDNAIHTFMYNNKKIYLSRNKSNPLMGSDSRKPFTPESLTLTVWNSDNEVLKQILSDALASSLKELTEDSLNIYVTSSSWWTGWELAMTKKARSKDSVILDVDDMDILLNDARKFLSGSEWYFSKGIPYRRGYLLYGPPGCGKTSFAQVLAGDLKLDICMLNLTDKELDDNKLCEYLREAPRNSVIVLEDVDAVFLERSLSNRGDNGKPSCSVSFSGLLNAIDGVASQEGKIFFMTTNHIEKLDPALIRPGRCDVKLEVKLASKQQIERMFLRFYPGETELARQFVARLPANELSMAALQGHFLNDSLSAQECVDRTPELLQSIKHQFKDTSKTIYDHLCRLGLERYASVFEFSGYSSSDDLTSKTVESVALYSVELQYDTYATKLLEKLFNNDKDVLAKLYSIATVAEIRSSFLSAYPTTYEKNYGEVAPFLRRLPSHTKSLESSKMTDLENSLVTSDVNILPSPVPFERNLSNLSINSNVSDSPEQLDSICRLFCETLSNRGKGIISLYNLKILLECHPNRPMSALHAARTFVQKQNEPRVISRPKTYTLYEFLKRAGLGKYIHTFIKRDIKTVQQLLSISKSSDSVKSELSKFRLSENDENILVEIISKKASMEGSLINFMTYYRPRIINLFISFYNDIHANGDSDESDDNKNNDETKNESTTAMAPLEMEIYTSDMLEQYAYEYAVNVTDWRGYGLVSLIEISNHLQKYKYSPSKAVESAVKEVVSPPYPTPPPAAPPAPEPTEWVHTWLREGSEHLTKYTSNFIDQNLCSEEDLVVGGKLLDDVTLKEVLGVSSLGDRRRIISMHDILLKRLIDLKKQD